MRLSIIFPTLSLLYQFRICKSSFCSKPLVTNFNSNFTSNSIFQTFCSLRKKTTIIFCNNIKIWINNTEDGDKLTEEILYKLTHLFQMKFLKNLHIIKLLQYVHLHFNNPFVDCSWFRWAKKERSIMMNHEKCNTYWDGKDVDARIHDACRLFRVSRFERIISAPRVRS